MRETISYNKTKNSYEEFLKMKPQTKIEGKITVQLVNNETNEIEQEIFTENVRMKWLEYQIYTDGLMASTPLWDLAVKYAGYSTSYGRQFTRGGQMPYLLLNYTDSEEVENEKRPSLKSSNLGYAGFDTVYSGTDVKKGSFNQVESNIKINDKGNLVMHNVYDFPTHACNGTISHIGYAKKVSGVSYRDNVIYASNWNTYSGLPSPLVPCIGAIPCSAISTNCYHVGKNTFRMAMYENSTNGYCILDLDIATGLVSNKFYITMLDDTVFKTPYYVRSMQISNDGTCMYMIVYNTNKEEKFGSTEKGWNLLTFSCDTGKLIDHKYLGRPGPPDQEYAISEYSVATYDEVNSTIYFFGGISGNTRKWIIKKPINETTYTTVEPADADTISISTNDVYRGTLILKGDEIIYKKNTYHFSEQPEHLFFDKETMKLKSKTADTMLRFGSLMHIKGKEDFGVAFASNYDNDNSNTKSPIGYWGLYDLRGTNSFTTLTKLPTPVLKTAVFTMKVQYDIVFEIPNVTEALFEQVTV